MIYGDVFMLINAACDYLALFLTALFLRRRVKRRRLFLGAAIGGVYALCYLYLSAFPLLCLLLSLVFSALMTLAAFSFGSLKNYLRALFAFYVVSLLLGGGVNALCAFLPTKNSVPLSLLLLTLFLFLSALCTLLGGKLLEARAKDRHVEIAFTYRERGYACLALVDSGNLLVDKESLLPVIVLSPALFAETPPCGRSVHIATVSGQTSLPCFEPEKLTVGKTERKAVLAIAVRAFGDGQIAGLVPETLLL